MSNTIIKRSIALFLVMLFSFSFTAYATPELSEVAEHNYSVTETLFAKINELRTDASKSILKRDEGLDNIALYYAYNIFYNRQVIGDYKYLSNGERVISLAKTLDVDVTGFNYSVFMGLGIEIESTNEFQSKAIDGDFTRIGIIFLPEFNGYYSNMVIIIYDKTPIL